MNLFLSCHCSIKNTITVEAFVILDYRGCHTDDGEQNESEDSDVKFAQKTPFCPWFYVFIIHESFAAVLQSRTSAQRKCGGDAYTVQSTFTVLK